MTLRAPVKICWTALEVLCFLKNTNVLTASAFSCFLDGQGRFSLLFESLCSLTRLSYLAWTNFFFKRQCTSICLADIEANIRIPVVSSIQQLLFSSHKFALILCLPIPAKLRLIWPGIFVTNFALAWEKRMSLATFILVYSCHLLRCHSWSLC